MDPDGFGENILVESLSVQRESGMFGIDSLETTINLTLRLRGTLETDERGVPDIFMNWQRMNEKLSDIWAAIEQIRIDLEEVKRE